MMATWTLLAVATALPPARRVPVQVPRSGSSSTAALEYADANFRAWPALNDEKIRRAVNAGQRYRLHLLDNASMPDPTLELFSHDKSLMSRFGLALAAKRAVDRKEFFEACEFFARVRNQLVRQRRPNPVPSLLLGHAGSSLH